MNRTVQITADGSETIAVEELNVTYHSRHGAMQESLHVFIEAGLKYLIESNRQEPICIFEMGFGTGLNALLSLDASNKSNRRIYYYAVEQFPLGEAEWRLLNYGQQLNLLEEFKTLHECEWNKDVAINDSFVLHKTNISLQEVEPVQTFQLIYFDAFAPAAQPELWTEHVFGKMYGLLQTGGVLVTYCSKGDVRRAMVAAGLKVDKLKGPPGKREMLRAIKPL